MSFTKSIQLLALSVLVLWLSSCSLNKQKGPDQLMEKARSAMNEYQFQKAKQYIDSVRIVFPKEYEKIKESLHLLHEIEFAEQKRTREYCDSLLTIRQKQFPEKQKNFTFQQNKAYESVGYYVHISQRHIDNYNRTYLQAKVDAKGQLILTSYYCGTQKIEHDKVRIYAPDGVFTETLSVPCDGALNYTFRDGELHYEIVRFNEKKINGLIDFILMHENDELQVELIGKKKHHYSMRNNDKKALIGACDLSLVLSDMTRLLNEIRLAQAKMEYILEKQR